MQWLRVLYVVAWEIAVGILALVWATVGTDLFNMVTGSGEHTGPFSDAVKNIDLLMPALIGALALAGVVYLIVGGVQDERKATRRRV